MTKQRNKVSIFIIGLCMGIADAVPGVSGGTIALLVGIYDRLIDAITEITPMSAWRLVCSFSPYTEDEPAVLARQFDFRFLLTLGAGAVSALVVVANVVEWLHVVIQSPCLASFLV